MIHVNSLAKDVNPRTKSTIVPYLGHNPATGEPTLPPELFRQVHLVFSRRFRHHSLVTAFQYDKNSGDVFYDPPNENAEGNGYARLITLNSWWRDLARAVAHTTLQFGDLTSNVLFMADIFEEPSLEKYSTFNIVFTIAWLAIVLSWYIVAHAEALKEWRMRTHPNIGDISKLPGIVDEWMSYNALVLFIFFGLDSMIRDIVTYLHPWKGIQPYAAFKNQGTRAFVVGFPDESHFKMENWSGQFIILPMRFAATVLSFGYKLFLVVVEWDINNPQYFLFATLTTSLFSMIVIVRKWTFLRIARRVWWKQKKKAKINEPRGPGFDTGWRDRVFEYRHFSGGLCACVGAICGLLMAPIVHLFRSKAGAIAKETCVCCGRPHESAHFMETRKMTAPQEVGELVMLAGDYRAHSDARHGVLKPDDLGRVVKKSEFVNGYGCRVLVQCVKDDSEYSDQAPPDDFENTWWYDTCALRKPTDEEAYIAQHRIQGASEDMRNIHKLVGQIQLAGMQINEELLEMSDHDRLHAREVITNALAEVVDVSLFQVEPISPVTSHGHAQKVACPVKPMVSFHMHSEEIETAEDTSPIGSHPPEHGAEVVGPSSPLTPREAAIRKTIQAAAKVDAETPGAPSLPTDMAGPLTPREAAIRKTIEAAANADAENPTAPSLPTALAGLRSKVLVSGGERRIGLAVLGGLAFHKPDTAEMLKHVAKLLGSRRMLQLNISVVTASNQGVEQKLTEWCCEDTNIVNLVQFQHAVPSRKGVDIPAGATYMDLRNSLAMVADICIVVEGGQDTGEDARLALHCGAKIIPVSKYGGAAAGGRYGFPEEVLDRPDWAQTEDWVTLSNHASTKKTAVAVANLLEQAVHAFRRSQEVAFLV